MAKKNEKKLDPHLLFLVDIKELRVIVRALKKAGRLNDAKNWQQKIDNELRDFETTEKYRNAAGNHHEHEGTLEFDPGCVVSMGDDPGAYVQAWQWVTNEEAGIETEEEEKTEEDEEDEEDEEEEDEEDGEES